MMNVFKKLEIFSFKILYLLSFSMFILFLFLMKTDKTLVLEFCIFNVNSISLTFPILLDSVSTSFSSVMLFISASVVWFANYYMQGEKFMNRFIALILLFILSMNFLIFVPNLVTLLLGWDGLGIVSFLLVIYYQNSKSLGAGLVTILSNRVGDALLIVSIGWMFSQGSWDAFYTVKYSEVLVVLWCVVIAAMTKSAQIPFSAWLPAAMAAPTPVSALVHSSTLVTAGVYLLIRFSDQIFINPTLSWFLLCTGTLTTLMAGISAVYETDLKKIIALSTLSQLGVMMFSLSLGLKELAIFHLFTHALFKALLFMCAGSMIHSHHHSQDIRKMGMMWYFMPISTTCLNIANLSLCGFPFLSGFYSKDLILESMLENNISYTMLALMVLATFLTTAYTARLTFLSTSNLNNFYPLSTKIEETGSNVKPIIIMTTASIFSGASLFWSMNSESSEPYLTLSEKFTPLILILSAFLFSYMIQKSLFGEKMKNKLAHACSTMWFIAPLTTQPTLAGFFYPAENNIKIIDQGWNEILGGQGVYKLAAFSFSKGNLLQFNQVNIFLLFILTNMTIMAIYL